MLPRTQAQLHVNGIRYTGKINREIQYRHYNNRARSYVVRKMGLQDAAHLVDWASIGRHNKSLSLRRQATKIKFMFRWGPTNSRLFDIGQHSTPLCPLCETDKETHTHVAQCMAVCACKHRCEALWDLEHTLVENHTHPDLTTLLLHAVEHMEAPATTTDSPILQRVMAEQAQIGWRHIRYGFLTTSWQVAQQAYLDEAVGSSAQNHGQLWTRMLQTALWDYTSGLWDNRNNTVHGKTRQEASIRRLQKLRQQVEKLLKDPPTVGAESSTLFDNHDILRRNGITLTAWLKQVTMAERKEVLRQKREIKSKSDLARITARRRTHNFRNETAHLKQQGIAHFAVRRTRPNLHCIDENSSTLAQQQNILPILLQYIGPGRILIKSHTRTRPVASVEQQADDNREKDS